MLEAKQTQHNNRMKSNIIVIAFHVEPKNFILVLDNAHAGKGTCQNKKTSLKR